MLSGLTAALPLLLPPQATGHVTDAICPQNSSWWCGPATASSRIAIIVIVAVVARIVAHRAITRVVRRTANGLPVPLRRISTRARELFEADSPLVSERRQQRAETIGSVLRSITSFMVLGIAFVMVLNELGLNIAPVLTGAGILGVAVGFGAQNLVKDFLSGMFMILEDQYGVGDVVDAGVASGNVEAVGLRTTRVRDVRGVVWHIRNGEIARIGNMSQGWARAVLDVPVAYSESVDRAKQVIKAAADSVWRDPAFAAVILEEPEVWGIESFDKDGLTVRLVVKTRPLKQWDVARAVRLRLKDAFDAEGVEIPLAQRSVWLRTTGDRSPQPGVSVHRDAVDVVGEERG